MRFIVSIVVLLPLVINAQTTTIGVGMGFDSYTIRGTNEIFITDSIAFGNNEVFSNPLQGPIVNDARAHVFVQRDFIDLNKIRLGSGLYFSRQWVTINIARRTDDATSPFPYISYRPVLAKYTFFTPIHVSTNPFAPNSFIPIKNFLNSLKLSAGFGPSFHLGNITTRIDGFVLNLENNREDPFYYETYYQFGTSAHRAITFNYFWSVSLAVFKSFGLEVMGSGSIGSVTKPFSVFGNEYTIPVQRRGLAAFLTYSFKF